MQSGFRFSTLIKLLLPVLILWLFNISPLPHDFSSSLYEARLAQTAGQHRLAAARLKTALDLQPQRVDLWEPLGLEELAAGRAAEALQALQNAQAADTLSEKGYLALGDAYHHLGQEGLAVNMWRASLVEFGPAAAVYQRLAKAMEDRGDATALLAVYQAWHKLEPDDPQVSYQLGLRLSVQNPTEALPLLMDAARRDAGLDGRVQVLRRGLNQASVAEDRGYGWVMIGRALAQLKEWELARQAFERAVAAAPKYAEAWAFLAEARFQTGEDGEDALAKAHQLNHDSTLVQAITAIYWRRQGRLAEALSYLEVVARQEPDEPTWQIEIGNTLAQMGDLQGALDRYQNATSLAPKSAIPWIALAVFSTQYHVDVREIGLPAARQALLLQPNDPETLDTMGQVFMTLGDDKSAERFLQRAIEYDASYAGAYLHLGQLYLQQPENQQAQDYLRQAQLLDPSGSIGEIAGRLLQQYFQTSGNQ